MLNYEERFFIVVFLLVENHREQFRTSKKYLFFFIGEFIINLINFFFHFLFLS